MDSLTEWKEFTKLVQSFAGEKVGNDELRWAPDDYHDSLDSPEFLQLWRVAATLEHQDGGVFGGTPGYRIRFGKRVEKGKMQIPGDGPLLEITTWDVAPERPGHWSVPKIGTDCLSSRELADKTKHELIRYHEEFCRKLKDLTSGPMT